MQDVLDVLKNLENIFDNNTSFNVLKDFERVIDELDVYIYKNWEDGELIIGPDIKRHWVSCSFMWPRDRMPDPQGGKRLVEYGCKVKYKKDFMMVPRKIETPDDIRPNTKKGKLDRKLIWIVEISMPKQLIVDIASEIKDDDYSGVSDDLSMTAEPQSAEISSMQGSGPGSAPGSEPPLPGMTP